MTSNPYTHSSLIREPPYAERPTLPWWTAISNPRPELNSTMKPPTEPTWVCWGPPGRACAGRWRWSWGGIFMYWDLPSLDISFSRPLLQHISGRESSLQRATDSHAYSMCRCAINLPVPVSSRRRSSITPPSRMRLPPARRYITLVPRMFTKIMGDNSGGVKYRALHSLN